METITQFDTNLEYIVKIFHFISDYPQYNKEQNIASMDWHFVNRVKCTFNIGL